MDIDIDASIYITVQLVFLRALISVHTVHVLQMWQNVHAVHDILHSMH